MFTLITWEHEDSLPVTRNDVEMVSAYKIAKNGGFFKAQIVNEFGVLEYEF